MAGRPMTQFVKPGINWLPLKTEMLSRGETHDIKFDNVGVFDIHSESCVLGDRINPEIVVGDVQQLTDAAGYHLAQRSRNSVGAG